MLTKEVQIQLRTLMIEGEGYSTHIYRDTKGNESVGIGHLCANGFSPAVIEAIYNEDWLKHYNYLLKSFPFFDALVVNDPPRALALVSMSFNLGDGHFGGFTGVIKAMAARDYKKAADEMRNSLWSHQVPARVKRLSDIIETGKL